ncbi:MAG TPA: GNAT family N-acetyltransferase, partial [Aggregatilineales bacterium]|nr:GNAT family N-acetyltransferase [Aggregatilineales bacterium]
QQKSMLEIVQLTPSTVREHVTALVAILRDSVDNGASVGFLPPLALDDAREYWEKVIADMETGSRLMLGAFLDGRLVGTVQLELVMRFNGLHRAEVQKLLVHTDFRRQGIGAKLLMVLEAEAKAIGRTVLVLDTRKGDAAEHLYRNSGYTTAGEIPQYARSANGKLEATVFFYRLLEAE